MKKTNNHVLKSISVNKQIQYQKKNLSKNNENNFFYSYNGFSGFKVTTTTNANNTNDKITKSYINVNNITSWRNKASAYLILPRGDIYLKNSSASDHPAAL